MKQEAAEEAAEEASRIPSYWEYQGSVPQAQLTAISSAVREYTTKIRSELAELGGRGLTGDDEYVIGDCVRTVVGYEKNFIKRVAEPTGVLVGGSYPDACVHNVVPHTHQFPNLMQSKSFAELYRKFLAVANKLSKSFEALWEPKYAEILKAELAGTYKYIPKVEKPPVHPTPAPSSISVGAPVAVPQVSQVPVAPSRPSQPSPLVDWSHLDGEARRFLQGQ
jgi:hypothetical protein